MLPSEVAHILSITETQVYTLLREGDLPAIKIGNRGVWRVERQALEDYIERLYAETRAQIR
jgi:excisionase family DNA binding protein